MGTQNRDTAAAILEASRKEFMEYGYEKASLRRIAKEASVTTGAIYGYFAGKDALFAALTEDAAEELVELYTKVHSDFASLPPEEQPDMLNVVTEECVPWLVNYVDHDIPREEAMSCSLILSRFQHAGWKKILNLPS